MGRKPDYTHTSNYAAAGDQWPRLVRSLDECEKLLKDCRSKRSKGLANDIDVESAREARDAIRSILIKGNWIH